MKSIQQLQETIHYQFRNPAFLEVALTHSSYANEVKHQIKYNERQEFLGDAVLSIIVSDYLFQQLHPLPEGELTKLRAAIVCEKSLERHGKQDSGSGAIPAPGPRRARLTGGQNPSFHHRRRL